MKSTTVIVMGCIIACAQVMGCQSVSPRIRDAESLMEAAQTQTGLDVIAIEALSEQVRMVRRVTVRGSHRDLGFVEGTAARNAGIPLPLVSEGNPSASKKVAENKKIAVNGRIASFYREVYPQHLEKVRGTAEAYGVPFEAVDLSAMERGFYDRFGTEGYDAEKTVGAGFPSEVGSCSVVGASIDRDGGMVHLAGRNLDTFNITGFLVSSSMDGVYASLAMSGESFYDYVVDGINEHGLFVAEMSILDPAYTRANLSKRYPDSPSVYMLRMMRIVLDTCANVEEAIALFQKAPVWFTHDLWHYYLADAEGNRCVVEYDRDGIMRVIRGEGSYLVSTNTPLLEGREALSRCPRWSVAETALSQGKIRNQADLYRLMGVISVSKRNPWLESWVPVSYLQTLRTVWTTVYDLTSRSMELFHWEDGYARRVETVPVSTGQVPGTGVQ